MRRLRILTMVAALAVAGVAILPGTAQAARGSKFCEEAEELYDEARSVDPSELGSLDEEEIQEQIDNALDAYKELEKSGPKKLRKAFRVNRKYLESFEDIDFADPEAFEDIAEQGTKVVRATTKIVNYLIDECGLDIPEFEVPDVSVPDVSIPDVSIPEIPELEGN